MLTINETKVMRLLATSQTDHSINEISKECHITPNGAYKILSKLEKEGILRPHKIANIKSYKLDFSSPKTAHVLELAFIPKEIKARIKSRVDDLARLKPLTKASVLFGSYITSKSNPKDLDILFVLDEHKYSEFTKTLEKVKDIVPIKIHDVLQTPEDLKKNLKKSDSIITAALRHGIVLWGFSTIGEIVEHAQRQN
ncbi:MAG TPA: helix-turn-helix domain-containing protein [Candidatus Nanoarchaeia archaeon]|nr:helix-turn-helix domain-containing protein [Candidatus Nanoarchaeia archaeon]